MEEGEDPTPAEALQYEMVMAEVKLCSQDLAEFLEAVAHEDSLEDQWPDIMLAVYWYAHNHNADKAQEAEDEEQEE